MVMGVQTLIHTPQMHGVGPPKFATIAWWRKKGSSPVRKKEVYGQTEAA